MGIWPYYILMRVTDIDRKREIDYEEAVSITNF